MSNVARGVIELAGIPGSGKSTLYLALTKARNLLAPEFLTSRECLAAPRLRSAAVLESAAARVAVHRIDRLAQTLYCAPGAQRISRALPRLGEHYRTFLRVCLHAEGEDIEWPEYRLMGFRWLSEVVERYALFEAAQRALRPMLVDEGLAQKAPALIPFDSQNGNRHSAYYESMPLVRSVVFLRSPVSIAHQRLAARSPESVSFRQRYLTERERLDDLNVLNKAFTDGLRILGRRGVEVVELDATLPLGNNVSTLLDFLNTVDPRDGGASPHGTA